MIKRVFLNGCRKIGFITASLIIICAVLLTVARFASPLVEKNKPFFERITSRILQHPVQIGQIKLSWQGLEPAVNLMGVSIQSEDHQRLLFKLDHVNFAINLWQSVRHQQILPDHVDLSGAEVTLKQQPNGQWRLLGVGNFSQESSLSTNAKQLFYWLALQSNISIHGAGARLFDNQQHSLFLQGFSLIVHNSENGHYIRGVGAILSENDSTPVRFQVTPYMQKQNPSDFNADFFVQLPRLNVTSWWSQSLISSFIKPFGLNKGGITAEIEGKIRHQHLQEINGKVSATNIQFSNTKNEFAHAERLSFNFDWRQMENAWACNLNHIVWQNHQLNTVLNQINLSSLVHGNEPEYKVYLDKISLSVLKNLFHFSEWWNNSFAVWDQRLEPNGQLQKVNVQYQVNNDKPNYIIESEFSDVDTKPWEKFPGANNLKGKIYLTPETGVVNLNAANLTIVYPYLFKNPLAKIQIKTQLVWQRVSPEAWLFQIPELTFDNENLYFQGKVKLTLPEHAKPILNVSGHFNARDVGQLKNYVPETVISSNLHNWLLQAFDRGAIPKGEIQLDTALKPSLRINMQVENFDLRYADNWPLINKITGILTIDDQSMVITSDHAFTAGNALSNVSVKIPDLVDPIIYVSGNAHGTTQAGIDFLRASPLDVGKAVTGWAGKGNVVLQLNLKKKLSAESTDADVTGKVELQNSSLNMMPVMPAVTQIMGEVNFHNENVFSDRLIGKMLNQSLAAKISTDFDAKHQPWLVFKIQGDLSAEKLAPLFPAAFAGKIQGQAPYDGILKVTTTNKGELRSDVTLTSSLAGLSIQVPAPYAKISKQIAASKMHLYFDEKDNLNLFLQYKNLLSFAGKYHANKDALQFQSGELHLGKGQAKLQKIPGLLIDGSVTRWDWKNWYPTLQPALHYVNHTGSGMELRLVSLDIANLGFLNQHLSKAYLNISPKPDYWKISVNSKEVNGNIYLPKSVVNPWRIELEKFGINLNDNDKSQLNQWKSEINPRKLPAFEFSCQQCQYNQNNLGAIKLKVSKNAAGINIDELNIYNKTYSLILKGQWSCILQNQCATSAKGYLSTHKLGDFLGDWGITQALTDGLGTTTFNLQWPSSPFNPAWSNMTGRMYFNYNDGRIVQLSSDTESKIGLGRLLNILSLQSLPQTLLGFTRLGARDKGFEFSTLKGELFINNGVGVTKNLQLEGPVAWVKVNGGIYFGPKRYNLHMKVIPNFTSSLPVIIGLTSGPFAGAITWLADKVLASKIGAVAASDYQVKGTWQNPDITPSENENNGKIK